MMTAKIKPNHLGHLCLNSPVPLVLFHLDELKKLFSDSHLTRTWVQACVGHRQLNSIHRYLSKPHTSPRTRARGGGTEIRLGGEGAGVSRLSAQSIRVRRSKIGGAKDPLAPTGSAALDQGSSYTMIVNKLCSACSTPICTMNVCADNQTNSSVTL